MIKIFNKGCGVDTDLLEWMPASRRYPGVLTEYPLCLEARDRHETLDRPMLLVWDAEECLRSLTIHQWKYFFWLKQKGN